MVFILLFFKKRNQHAELRTPVAHVVRTDHLVSEKLQRAYRRITNDGGADVAHVHLFRNVGRRVVDHNGLGFGQLHAQARQTQRFAGILCQPVVVEEDIDEARSGNFNFAGDAGQIEVLNYRFR